MNRYRMKALVEAWRFNGQALASFPPEILAGLSDGAMVYHGGVTPWIWVRHNGEHVAVGDWLVRDASGVFDAMSAQWFAQVYQLATDQRPAP